MKAADVVAQVADPELPFLTIAELGILRDVEVVDDQVIVSITPTYSGCPAMREIHSDIRRQLTHAGYLDVEVRTVLQPPWTTDWITADGRDKLTRAGIAPPATAFPKTAFPKTAFPKTVRAETAGPVPLSLTPTRPRIVCPRCGSTDTEELARFAATACQALHRCRACAEPFNAVKEI